MHIVFFNRSYWPDQAATGQLLTELAEDLVRNYGCRVSVVAGLPLHQRDNADLGKAERRKLIQRETHHGVDIYRAIGTTFPPGRFVARVTNYVSYFLSACLAGLRLPRPDIVVSLTDPPIIGLAGLFTARRFGAKFVFLCQDIFPEVASLLEDFHSDLVDKILTQVNRFIVRQADRIIALGDTMRRRLVEGKGADPRKVSVIHNWVDCSSVEPGSKHNPFSEAHGLANAFVVMHSGNIGLSQNLDMLIDAAQHLQPYDDLAVTIVGGGAKRNALQARVQEQGLGNVQFFPYQPKEHLHDSFATADVFIVSLKQGLAGYIVPSKLYGILAAGRPYVAAVEEECEVASITREYNCGLLAEPGNSEDLADKILTLYRDRALAQQLGANARQAALDFDRSRQVALYHNLFQELQNPKQFQNIQNLEQNLENVA